MNIPHPPFLKPGGGRRLLSAAAVCLILILTGLSGDALAASGKKLTQKQLKEIAADFFPSSAAFRGKRS